MLVSRRLLEKYVDLSKITDEEISNKLTFAGIEVEQYFALSNATNLVIGEVVTSEKIKDADNLSLCSVTVKAGKKPLSIVCGAPNVAAGQKVIVAQVGALLGDFKIKKATIKGVPSEGMICSLSELGVPDLLLSEESKAGIHVLPSDAVVGNTDVLNYLGLEDTLFDVRPLPNRSDVYSVINLARELSALFERPFLWDRSDVTRDFKTKLKLSVTAQDTPAFTLTEIKNITVTESPAWLKDLLLKHEMRPINTVVDVANYVMLLTGRPLHMYDLDKVKSKTFVVEDNLNTKFMGLDETEYEVKAGDQVITVNNEVACLGGVLGALDSAVTLGSTNIAMEVAVFNQTVIRKTSQRLSLLSDASLRFSRGINFSATSDAVTLALTLIKELHQTAKVSDTVSVTLSTPEEQKIVYDPELINKLLGTAFSDAEIKATLARLNIFVTKDNTVKYPPYRRDLFTNADLAEEVIRLKGFSFINEELPALAASVGSLTPYQARRKELRSYLRNSGLYEVLTYTLVSKKEAETFTTLHKHKLLKLRHPMTPVHEYLRGHILPSLLNTVNYNTSRQNSDFGLFEISEITAENYHAEHLAIALVGQKSLQEQLVKTKYDFYDMKGYVESIFTLFGVKSNRVKFVAAQNYPEFHPYQTAEIIVQGKLVGVLGVAHPNITKALNISTSLVLLELNLTEVLSLQVGQAKMEKVSRYPSVTRDVAFVVGEEVTTEAIITTLKRGAGKLVQDIVLFDVFKSPALGHGKKSVALGIKLQAQDATLREEEINEVIKQIIQTATTKLGAELRG